MPVAKIGREDVAAGLARIKRESGSVSVLRARVALSGLFVWVIGEGIGGADLSNPVIGTNKPDEPPARDRVLTDSELAEIWAACRDDDFGRIVKLLMLTGARRDEVGNMNWSELDLDRGVWTIPSARTKNKRQHVVPLAAPTLEIIEVVAKRDDRDGLFGRGEKGFGGWSKAKELLDKRITKARGVAAEKAGGPADGVKPKAPWRLHDLRRTCATIMADRLGVLPHIVEAVLNHVSGHKAGVAGVYNRSTYEREVRAALELWGEHVRAVVKGGKRNVVALRPRLVPRGP
jgi:integrase